MSSKTQKMDRLFELLGDGSPGGGSFQEMFAAVISKKNKEHALAFSKTPLAGRLLIVPQCLRAVGACKAEERSMEYLCGRCGACKISKMADRVEELGCMGIRILKGGSAIGRILQDLAPAAVLGVACDLEGALGMLEADRRGMPVQFIPLLRDGCADTDVDLDEVLDTLEFRQP